MHKPFYTNVNILSKNQSSHFSWFIALLLILILTSCSSRKKPAPVQTIYGNPSLGELNKNSINADYYTVQKGETLYSIAWRANKNVNTLAKLNDISSPYHIFPGQKLLLVVNKLLKTSKTNKTKPSAVKSNKHSSKNTTQQVKKTVAPNKKQEYGKVRSEQKTNKTFAVIPNNFSTKVRQWRWPVKGKIIERFSTAQNGNKGINIVGRRGDNIKAAASGKVVYAGSALRGYGKLIIVKHNEDYLSAYAHNDKILVKEQQLVKAGDVIGKMGDTGAQRVMLHFEVRFRGKSVNPMKYLSR